MSYFNEDWVTLSALVALVVSILPLIKFLHELISSNKQFKVKHLELLHQSFGEPNNPAMKLMVEQQFCSVFKCSASFEDICVLLSASKATKAVELYKGSHAYVDCDGEKFTFVDKYRDPKKRMKEYAHVRDTIAEITVPDEGGTATMGPPPPTAIRGMIPNLPVEDFGPDV